MGVPAIPMTVPPSRSFLSYACAAAVSTREYQTDQSSLKTAPTAARSVFGKGQKQRQRQEQHHSCAELTRSLHIRPIHSLGSSGVGLGASVLETAFANRRLDITENPTFRERSPSGLALSVSALALMLQSTSTPDGNSPIRIDA